MARFITSDHHFGESRMELMGRPFKASPPFLAEYVCAEYMMQEHNKMVSPDDEVIFLGDVCYQKTPDIKYWLHWVERFNGRKTLVRGNHDRVISDEQFAPYFEKIIPDGGRLELEAGGVQCVATHYPTEGDIKKFNLVGHIHAAWKYQLNMLNVGVDVHHFRPVNLDTIPFHLKAITEFYDEDVWVAYNRLNSVWNGIRGKKGTYFRPYFPLEIERG